MEGGSEDDDGEVDDGELMEGEASGGAAREEEELRGALLSLSSRMRGTMSAL